MKVNTEIDSLKFEPSNPLFRLSHFFVIGIFILGFALRLYHINAPPLDFEPDRHYHSFILARNYFFQASKDIPDWRKELWKEIASEEYIREPPILEYLVAWAYRITGKEQFWIARSLSVIFWMAGGWVLLRMISNLIGREAAAISLIFYFLNPFAISASRAFMPDPLMILLTLLAINSFVEYHSSRSRFSLLASAILSGLAALIKPFCLIPLFTIFIFVNIESKNLRSTVKSAVGFLIVVLLVVLPYYLAGLLPQNGFLRGYAASNFLPKLWLKPYFWGGWFDLIRMTVGYIPFIAGLFGILLAPNRVLRNLLIGFWLGYLCFGLIFTYSIHTQDYYHIILIPLLAISLAPIGHFLFKSLASVGMTTFSRFAFLMIVIFAVAASIHEARSRWKAVKDYIEVEVASAIEIGREINHTIEVVSLASYYARPLKYHGELGGKRWPYTYDFRANEIIGLGNEPAQARFQQYMKMYSPKYFVVSDLEELNRQQELKRILYDNFPVFKENRSYVIFSLRAD